MSDQDHTFVAPDGRTHCRCGLADAKTYAEAYARGPDMERLRAAAAAVLVADHKGASDYDRSTWYAVLAALQAALATTKETA